MAIFKTKENPSNSSDYNTKINAHKEIYRIHMYIIISIGIALM